MDKHGQFFPDDPQSIEELIDSLARRAAAQERMMAGLSPEQRAELSDLMAQTMADMGLASEMAHLQDALRQARPDLPWGQRGQVPDGEQALGLGDATSAVAELADLEALSNQLSQGYAGASLADIDEELLERALGRPAVDDLAALRQLERELERQGYLNRTDGRLELSPKAVRRLGATALRRVFAKLDATGRGEHDVADAGAAGRAHRQLAGVAVRRRAAAGRRPHGEERRPADGGRAARRATARVRIAVDDFEVVETERRTGAAVALLVDLSYSMALRGTWGAAKSTAMALHSLVTTRFPQDAIQIIGFSSTAQVLRPETLAELSVDTLQGTNLQHGLMLARRFLAHHRDAEPVVLVVTDGEPTAHLEDDGTPFFCWPPMPETIARTVAEVERVARTGATVNVFALDPDPGLVHFVHDLTQRAGGRVFQPDAERLGEYVVADYLRTRRGRRALTSGTPISRRAMVRQSMGVTARPTAVTVDEVPPRSRTRCARGPAAGRRGDHLGRRRGPGDLPPGRPHRRRPVVGVVRFSPAPCPWRPDARAPGSCAGWPPTRRSAAPAPAAPLVDDGLARVAARGGDLVWCDARATAAGFYERMGFTVVTDEFDKPGIGPHVGMVIEPLAGGCEPLELIPGIAPARKASTNRRWSSWVRRA